MRKIFVSLLILLGLVLFLGKSAKAGEMPREGTMITLGKYRQVFLNTDCEKTQTCDLKSVSIAVEHYKIVVMGDWTYGTSMVAEYDADFLGRYEFVNFAKGCVFDTSKKPDGRIERDDIFCSEGWISDLKTNDLGITIKRSVNKMERLVRQAFTHFPSAAINISLELKTCLYRKGILSDPIYCAYWQSSYVYNHSLDLFEMKNEKPSA